MLLSVIIPSYRRPELILRLLADLYAQQGVDFEVIVVDDCSPDDSVQRFTSAFPQARIFRNERNGGPAVARNRGIREARGEIIVGFDSDVTLPDSHVLRKVVEAYSENPQASGFAFRLLTTDGVTDDAPRWWHSQPLDVGKDRVFETSYFSGTAYSFKRSILLEAGLYPEWLYMHYEEYLLALRIMDCGGVILYHPKLTAIHHAHPVSRRSQIKVYYKPRNQILMALNAYPTIPGLFYALPRIAYSCLASIIGLHFGSFLSAMHSAYKIGRERIADRRPLKTGTWNRIRTLRSEKSW